MHEVTDKLERDSEAANQPVPALPNDPTVPDVFAEGVGIQVSFAHLNLIFNVARGTPQELAPVAVVRMTLPQAVVLTQVLRKALRAYEADLGPINVPEGMLSPLGLDREL